MRKHNAHVSGLHLPFAIAPKREQIKFTRYTESVLNPSSLSRILVSQTLIKGVRFNFAISKRCSYVQWETPIFAMSQSSNNAGVLTAEYEDVIESVITFVSEKEKDVYMYVCVSKHSFFSSDVFKVIIFNVRLFAW